MEAKPLASLSSGLLARKGQAKPAMRPQGFAGFGNMAGQLEDLGWNDMGHDRHNAAPEPAHVVPVSPEIEPAVDPIVPPVLRQRAVLRQEVEVAPEIMAARPPVALALEPVVLAPEPELEPEPEAEPEPVKVALPKPRRSRDRKPVAQPIAAKAKAAFTLRLDQDRHLRLRLATAVSGRSAQLLVTQALDRFLATLPQVEELARQLPAESLKGE